MPWCPDPAGVGDDLYVLDDPLGIGRDALGFDHRHEPLLETLIVGGDPGWAGVLVAFKGLDAAKGKHEAPRGGDEICAAGQSPCDIAGYDEPSEMPFVEELRGALGSESWIMAGCSLRLPAWRHAVAPWVQGEGAISADPDRGPRCPGARRAGGT